MNVSGVCVELFFFIRMIHDLGVFDYRMTSHSWHIATHARPTFCNVCREALSGKIDDEHYFYHLRLISYFCITFDNEKKVAVGEQINTCVFFALVLSLHLCFLNVFRGHDERIQLRYL